jgi:hypothetical protein
MKKISVFLIILFGIFSQNIIAQSIEKKDSVQANKTILVLKISPLSLLDPLSPALQIGAEYPLNARTSMMTELGLIYGSMIDSNNGEEGENIFGYRLRQEYRFYLSPFARAAYRGPYIGCDAFYKFQDNGKIVKNIPVDSNPDIPGPEFWRRQPARSIDRVFVFHLRLGSQHVLDNSPSSFFNRVVFDWSVGVGLRKIWEMETEFMDYKENSVKRALSLNLRFGYMFFK